MSDSHIASVSNQRLSPIIGNASIVKLKASEDSDPVARVHTQNNELRENKQLAATGGITSSSRQVPKVTGERPESLEEASTANEISSTSCPPSTEGSTANQRTVSKEQTVCSQPKEDSSEIQTAPEEPGCSRCVQLEAENDRLSRIEARLRQRLTDALETTQTHGQRLLRAAYQDKVRELTANHTLKTTEMLNMQKKCFEDELEAVDAENQAALVAMQRDLDAERAARSAAEERFQVERDEALEKTSTTMMAVQRKLSQLHARATRLEREKKSLASTVSEKQVMIEVLVSAAAAKDVERRRVEMSSKAQKEERERKDVLLESLRGEVAQLRERLGQERQVNVNLVTQIEEMEGTRKEEHVRHAEDLDNCKQQSKNEADRLGRLFASMMQDFSNVQSDVATSD